VVSIAFATAFLAPGQDTTTSNTPAIGGDTNGQEKLTVPSSNSIAFQEIKARAEKGDAHGQWELGSMYAEGRGMEKDKAEAAKWYAKAAEQGDAKKQRELGFMFAHGWGVEKDKDEALK